MLPSPKAPSLSNLNNNSLHIYSGQKSIYRISVKQLRLFRKARGHLLTIHTSRRQGKKMLINMLINKLICSRVQKVRSSTAQIQKAQECNINDYFSSELYCRSKIHYLAGQSQNIFYSVFWLDRYSNSLITLKVDVSLAFPCTVSGNTVYC